MADPHKDWVGYELPTEIVLKAHHAGLVEWNEEAKCFDATEKGLQVLKDYCERAISEHHDKNQEGQSSGSQEGESHG